MARKLRVLIVDDSSFMRLTIRRILTAHPEIEVVGSAADGIEALEKSLVLKPDVITMDVEMPRMNGIAAVKQICATSSSRIIMVSSHTNEGAKETFDALEAGAVDYVLKPAVDSSQNQFEDELIRKVRGAGSDTHVLQQPCSRTPAKLHPVTERQTIKYIGIGASTGGPMAIQEILMSLPATFPCPLVIAVHMPKTFTAPFAERLRAKCRLVVKEAEEGELLSPGSAYIAPGGSHITLLRHASGIMVKLRPTASHPGVYVPSVDMMMSSLSEAAGSAVLGIILTGMGNDGFKGLQHIKTRGGMTLVQDQSTSTVYGMPKACVDGGVADEVLPVNQIASAVMGMTMEKS